MKTGGKAALACRVVQNDPAPTQRRVIMEEYRCNDCGEVNSAEHLIQEFEGFDHENMPVIFYFCPDCESDNVEEIE